MAVLMALRSQLNELHEAKLELVGLVWAKPESKLWTIVMFIDTYLQQFVDYGFWKLPTRQVVVRKSEALPMELHEGDLGWDNSRAVGLEWRNGEWEEISYECWVARHRKGSENEE